MNVKQLRYSQKPNQNIEKHRKEIKRRKLREKIVTLK